VTPVVVVGGGLSGLAAAVRLTSRHIPVLLLEQRPYAGGRAYSFVDDATGTVIDNGQHVLIAGYAHTLAFLATVGTRGLLAVQASPELLFHHPVRGFCTFRLPRFPSPFHLAAGILATDLFSPGDKMRMARAGLALMRGEGGGSGDAGNSGNGPPGGGSNKGKGAPGGDAAALTVDEWLDAHGQSAETKRSFWEPLAVAIMNEHIGAASASVFIHAVRTAFLGDPLGAALAVPTVGLSELFAEPARTFVEAHAGSVRTGADVTEVVLEGGRAAALRVREGEPVPCSALVLAVPSFRLPGLLPAALRESGALAGAASIPLSPIVSIHLWFDADFMPQRVLGVIGRRIQWVFNRRKICREGGAGGHLSVVISAGHSLVDLGNEELVRIALDDLVSVFGSAARAPVHDVVIREKRATFSCTPAAERLRPGAETPLRNLFLAGDWTSTGYPATIEGAILSGNRAADLAERYIAAVSGHSA